MSPLVAYFWPGFAAGLVVGAATGTWIFRRRFTGSRKWLGLGLGVLLSIAAALVWSGPLGAARQFSDTVESSAKAALHYYEMDAVTARLGHDPLTRQLILQGPADEFQRSELVRLFSTLPGVSNATWTPGGALPLVAEMAIATTVGFLIGLLLAYLVELRRRYNAQWTW